MKTKVKKIQILSLATLIGFGGVSVINGDSVHYATHNQYVLSRYSPNSSFAHSPQIQKSQNNMSTTSLPKNTQTSSNWGGYIVTPTTNSSYTSVSGNWTVPNISANQRNASAAQWIGLGGVNSSDLLQMGTVEQIENGQPVAEVFWEKLPDVAQNIVSIPSGSTINVSISETSSSAWNLTFTANTPNNQVQTQTITVTLNSSYARGIGTSAEWISEDPSNGYGQLIPLANMGTVKYQSAMVNSQPLNASGNNVQPVAMVSNNRTIVISPSELGTDGESFTTASTNSTISNGGRSDLRPSIRRSRYRFGWW